MEGSSVVIEPELGELEGGVGGRIENRDGDGQMKDRYWSTTYTTVTVTGISRLYVSYQESHK